MPDDLRFADNTLSTTPLPRSDREHAAWVVLGLAVEADATPEETKDVLEALDVLKDLC